MKFLVLSFDDGTVYDERFVELLDRYQVPATFNLNSGLDDFVWYCDGHPIRRPRLADKPEIYHNHEVASHTLTHPWLTALPDEALIREVGEDAANLSRIYGREICSFGVPFDACGEREIRLIREHTSIRYLRLSEMKAKYDFTVPADPYHFGVNALYQDEDLRDQLRVFAENDLDRSVFIIAGHSYEFELNDHWGYIEDLIRYIKSLEGVEIVTFGEAAARLFPV
ncbi:MAG: polysaccharide deacetylase family protein [Lachnospiraceae bacterium]|nr:polysaccharide deacetylase family protein [Lachnospiraceae bacterium]